MLRLVWIKVTFECRLDASAVAQGDAPPECADSSKRIRLPKYLNLSRSQFLRLHSPKDRRRCFAIRPSRPRKSFLRMPYGVWLQDRIHSHTHTPQGPSRLSPGSIRSDRPAVPPHTAMQMKRNALIKGQILKMRGQEEDRGSEC